MQIPEIVKAISVWQPWASLIADGHKRFETRSWPTNHRGPLLICASKNGAPYLFREEIANECGEIEDYAIFNYSRLPFGRAVCIVNMVDCVPTEALVGRLSLKEEALGDFRPGRWAWDLRKPMKLEFPVRGKQRLFDVELPEGIGA